ncbi:MAG: hypothetical protein ACREKL_10015 [Chthoniobacterales bacterium]
MDAFFAELGRTVRKQWQKENFSLPAFPEIARTALEKKSPAKHVDLAALVREFLLDDAQPFQSASGFGQPELIVYDDPRFYIQILFWLEGTTQIHQHEFSGAFHVLQGSSLHSEFEFVRVKPVTAHFRLGDLKLKHTQLLVTESTVPIISGGACIHSLFHLDTPSVSVVVRTHTDPGTGPQFTYLPPHIAVDPFFTDALTTRRTQLLDVLERTGDRSYAKVVRQMVAELDFERGFFILQNCLGHLRATGAWDGVWAAFQKKHGALANPVLPTLEEIIRRDTLVGFRGAVTDPEHRFFLALLLNVPTRAGLLKLVAERYPGDAVQTVLRWAAELGAMSDFGNAILDAEFPAELDAAGDEPMDVLLAALEFFLEGGNGKMGAELKALRGVFARSSLRALVS